MAQSSLTSRTQAHAQDLHLNALFYRNLLDIYAAGEKI